MSTIAAEYDVTCIQEHWLHSYKQIEISQWLPGYCYTIKCFDEDDPEPPLLRTRGNAGTAIIWKQAVDHIVTPIDDGSHRVCAVSISSAERRLLLVNSYMPTQGADKAKADYDEYLTRSTR